MAASQAASAATRSSTHVEADAAEVPRPLTERLLARLPGQRVAWVGAWGVFVLVRPLAASAVLLATGHPTDAWNHVVVHLPHSVALAVVVVLALTGIRRLSRDASHAWRDATRLDPSAPDPRTINGLDHVVGPVLLAGAIVLSRAVFPTMPSSPLANLVDIIFLAAIAVPIATWAWTFGAVLVSIEGLGRRPLSLDTFPTDRGLGLLAIGSAPFNSFWPFAIAAMVYFSVVANELVEQVLGLLAFLGVLIALVLALWRLHVRMTTAKARHLAIARRLLAEASEPFWREPSLETLQLHAERMSAAEALEKRFDGILEWPIDERVVTRTVLVITGVITFLIARVVAAQMGIT
jgi:hypothetical protein